ncbi:MAG: DUF2779 domain-containing protein [Deferrisomatales bacterium]|nr:DUF2779 domain-containing protein [Deferrisomatales bacterium]
MRQPTISKTSFITGLQCPRALWYRLQRPEEIPEPDRSTQARFAMGNEVGDWSKRRFPGGVEVPWDRGPAAACKETARLLALRIPIYEATFRFASPYGPTLMRADILNPVGADRWDLIEVKATTRPKEVHVHDIAFQRYVAEGCGIQLRHCYVMHLDNSYLRQGPIDPKRLFQLSSIGAEVRSFLPEVEPALERMSGALALPEPPDVEVGPHCSSPYGCALSSHCWDFLPERNIFNLYRGGQVSWGFFEKGIYDRMDIPEDTSLAANQNIQLRADRTGEPQVDVAAIRGFLDGLTYPLYFMDFETLNAPVPLFDGTWPYGQVPFQYSVHVQDTPCAKLRHYGFLADIQGGATDPRPAFLEGLRDCLGDSGSIVVYNASFEKGRLREGADMYSEYRGWWEDNIEPRIVDLYAPFRRFAYYHPAQNGSASIKAVLPAITGKEGYAGMAIADGGTAASEYLRVHLGEVEPADKERIRAALVEYCGLDTRGMADILQALIPLAGRACDVANSHCQGTLPTTPTQTVLRGHPSP